MRTITVTQNIYEYDELGEDAKNKVKEWYRNAFHTPDEFEHDVINDLDILFENNDLDIQFNLSLDIQFSLSYTQGDGLNIYGKMDAKQFLDAMEKNGSDVAQFGKYADVLTEEEKRTIRGYCNFDNGYCHDFGTIELPKNKYYNYCIADNIDIAYSWSAEMEDFGLEYSYDLLKKFEGVVIDVFTALCDMYAEWGYNFFYDVDDDTVSDVCDVNGWEFYDNGDFYE